MSERERQEQILAEAKDFLEQHGLAQHVQGFLESEEAKQIMKHDYSALMEQVTLHKKNAPEELAEHAEEIYNSYAESEEAFITDAVANFQIRIHTSCEILPEPIFQAMIESGALKKTFEEGKEGFIKDLKEISHGMRREYANGFMEMLYDGYVPEGIPGEILDFVKMITGGSMMIPITAIFPGFGENSSSEKKN